MTHPDDTTALIERDLHAVDAALETGAATHDDPLARELQELALALSADAPEPDAAFAERLGGRVGTGFPRDARSFRMRAPKVARRALPAMAAFATVLVIGVAVSQVDFNQSMDDDGGGGASIAGGGDDDAGGGGGAVAEESAPMPQAGRALDSGAGGGVVVPGDPPALSGKSFARRRADRKIERSISMTLAAPNDEIPDVAQGVTEVTNRHGGFVLRSNLNSDDQGSTGFFELRIPSGRLRQALADLSGLATVRSQSQSGQDVTRQHVTATDRLQSARAERRSLLRRLELAATDEEAEAIRRRLDIVAGEINGLRGQLRDLRLRTDYAIVTVDLAGEDGDSGSGGAGGSLDDALGDAGDLLVGLTGALIRILAIALPLGLIALVAWLASRTFRRRRRESVLA